MGLAGRAVYDCSYRRRSWLAAIAMLFLAAGCTTDNPGGADNPGEALEPPKPEIFVEPAGQRSPYGNYLAGRYAERKRDFAQAATALGRAFDEFPDNAVNPVEDPTAPLPEAQGLQTNNPGYPGFSSEGWLLAAGLSLEMPL